MDKSAGGYDTERMDKSAGGYDTERIDKSAGGFDTERIDISTRIDISARERVPWITVPLCKDEDDIRRSRGRNIQVRGDVPWTRRLRRPRTRSEITNT